MSDTPIAPINNIPVKSGGNKSNKKAKDYFYAETVLRLNGNSVAIAPVFINEDSIKLSMVLGFENQRQPLDGNLLDQETTSNSYRVEPQAQINLGQNTLFLRSQYVKTNNKTGPNTDSFVGEAVIKSPDETIVVRGNVFVDNILDPIKRAVKVSLVPFIKVPVLPALGIKFRIGPEFTRDYSGKKNNVTINFKLDGSFKNDPWAGWGIQVFCGKDFGTNTENASVKFTGLYLWAGGVLPRNLIGEGAFIEGGLWLGRDSIIEHKTPMDQAFALGFNLKLKYGTEVRWWQ